jgi:hypothetical protein
MSCLPESQTTLTTKPTRKTSNFPFQKAIDQTLAERIHSEIVPTPKFLPTKLPVLNLQKD